MSEDQAKKAIDLYLAGKNIHEIYKIMNIPIDELQKIITEKLKKDCQELGINEDDL